MKQNIEPELKLPLRAHGTNYGFTLPMWFTKQFELQKGKRYKVRVIDEVMGSQYRGVESSA